jgi:hypothetical protein
VLLKQDLRFLSRIEVQKTTGTIVNQLASSRDCLVGN